MCIYRALILAKIAPPKTITRNNGCPHCCAPRCSPPPHGGLDRIPYEHYNIDVKLPTAPDKVDQVVAAMFAEIDSIRKDGPSQAELDKVKANWRQRHEQEMHENEHWLTQLQGSLLDGTPASNMLTFFDKGQQLTVADLRATAQRCLDKDNYVQVVMMPEAQVQTASVAK
jgi:zinc protease